jgi:hypothetical protein
MCLDRLLTAASAALVSTSIVFLIGSIFEFGYR